MNMVTIDRSVVQQALEALERYQVKRQDFDRFADEITALRAALAQQDEPVEHYASIPGTNVRVRLRAEQKEKPWRCACGANLYIDKNGAPRSKS